MLFFIDEYFVRVANTVNLVYDPITTFVSCSVCSTRVGSKPMVGRYHIMVYSLFELKPVSVKFRFNWQDMIQGRSVYTYGSIHSLPPMNYSLPTDGEGPGPSQPLMREGNGTEAPQCERAPADSENMFVPDYFLDVPSVSVFLERLHSGEIENPTVPMNSPEPVNESGVEPVGEPIVESSGVASIEQPISETAAQSTVESTEEPVVEPAAESAVEPVAEPSAESPLE